MDTLHTQVRPSVIFINWKSLHLFNFSDLLDLDPLPISALGDPKLESLFGEDILAFNAIQTQVFHCLYHTDENVVLGAATGSGKTVVAELAMFRVFREHPGMKVTFPFFVLEEAWSYLSRLCTLLLWKRWSGRGSKTGMTNCRESWAKRSLSWPETRLRMQTPSLQQMWLYEHYLVVFRIALFKICVFNRLRPLKSGMVWADPGRRGILYVKWHF